MADEKLTSKQVAAELQVQEQTLRTWRLKGIGPKFVKLHSGPKADIRYLRSDLDTYIAKQTVPTS